MKFKDILKIVGAGITGGYLALRLRRPRQDYDEFLQIHGAISIEFIHQLETVFLQTMLPGVPDELREEVVRLMEREATFLEQMRFFQSRLDQFSLLIVKAVQRLYRLRLEGSIAPTARRRLSCDDATFEVAVDEVFYDLQLSFSEALRANLDEEERALLDDDEVTLPVVLNEIADRTEILPSAFFDAYSDFRDRIAREQEPED